MAGAVQICLHLGIRRIIYFRFFFNKTLVGLNLFYKTHICEWNHGGITVESQIAVESWWNHGGIMALNHT